MADPRTKLEKAFAEYAHLHGPEGQQAFEAGWNAALELATRVLAGTAIQSFYEGVFRNLAALQNKVH